jgi:hypothetical protein
MGTIHNGTVGHRETMCGLTRAARVALRDTVSVHLAWTTCGECQDAVWRQRDRVGLPCGPRPLTGSLETWDVRVAFRAATVSHEALRASEAYERWSSRSWVGRPPTVTRAARETWTDAEQRAVMDVLLRLRARDAAERRERLRRRARARVADAARAEEERAARTRRHAAQTRSRALLSAMLRKTEQEFGPARTGSLIAESRAS